MQRGIRRDPSQKKMPKRRQSEQAAFAKFDPKNLMANCVPMFAAPDSAEKTAV